MKFIQNKNIKTVSAKEALKDVVPISWSDDVISGKKKVILKEAKQMTDIFKIKLDIKDINSFIAIAQSISNDINLCQGNSVVSGKSIMGVMTLDLSKPIDLVVRDRDDDDIVYKKFGRYLLDENMKDETIKE